jgi:hypothetical protein
MSNQTQAEKILAGVVHENMNVEYRIGKAQALATLALAEAVRGAAEPMEVRVMVNPREVVSVPDRDQNYVPGDVVGLTLVGEYWREYNGRHGVVIYGPDDDTRPGWQVSTAAGTLRCVRDELTMVTRREDRTSETDKEAYKWKDKL